MNKDYLPYYNSLQDKDKEFWLKCSKEELIDHLIANINNGEKLLLRIDKALDYINKLLVFGIRNEEIDLNEIKMYLTDDNFVDITLKRLNEYLETEGIEIE